MSLVDDSDSFRLSPEKYWNLDKLSQVPIWRPSPFPDSRCRGLQDILVTGTEVNGEHPEFFAYIGYPDGPVPDGGFPGIVLVHGGGGTAYPEYVKLWNSRGYAVIALDWYNQRPVLNRHGSKVQSKTPLASGCRQFHVANAANMILAHSLLRSLKNINPEKTAFVGLSWGSWYGAMVAAVDSRFRCCIEIYCGDLDRSRLQDADRQLISGRFLHAAKIPMYWIAGTNDQNVTLLTLDSAFRECACLHNKSLVIDLPHSHIGFRFESCFRIADAFLKKAPGLPRLGQAEISKNRISAPVLSEGKGFHKAILCYTDLKDQEGHYADRWFRRIWKQKKAEIADGQIQAVIPNSARQCFLSLYDEKDRYHTCCGSTNILEL